MAGDLDSAVRHAVHQLCAEQEDVVSRSQLIAVGVTRAQICTRLEARLWQRMYRGTYAVHTGQLSYRARAWSAILYAGDGAMASHETAAFLYQLIDRPP